MTNGTNNPKIDNGNIYLNPHPTVTAPIGLVYQGSPEQEAVAQERERILKWAEGMTKLTPYTYEIEEDPGLERECDSYNNALSELKEFLRQEG